MPKLKIVKRAAPAPRKSRRPAPARAPQTPPWPADKIERWPVVKLIPYARNARTHTAAQVSQIAGAIREWGWTAPALIDERGTIIAGHGRVLAAQQLGITDIPVMIARGWTEAQRRAYTIADNQIALNAGWDLEMLRVELTDLRGQAVDLATLGFGENDLVRILGAKEGLTDPDAVPPVPDVAVSRPGDLWLLGPHRLLCGSSIVDADVRRLMAGERALLFATDPPYAVGYKGGSHPAIAANRKRATRDKNWSSIYREADGDGIGYEFYEAFIRIACAEAIDDRAAWYCWHASVRAAMVERAWESAGAFVHQQIIWVKSRAVLTYSKFMWQHEPCHFGWRRTHEPACRIMKEPELDGFKSTVWQVPNSEAESMDHPTCKPTALFAVPMRVHTQAGDLCYEPFSGSGTQIMAAETLGRRCYAMEIAPVFVDVAVERWQAFTGEQAVREGDGRLFNNIKKRQPARKAA